MKFRLPITIGTSKFFAYFGIKISIENRNFLLRTVLDTPEASGLSKVTRTDIEINPKIQNNGLNYIFFIYYKQHRAFF